MLQDIRRVPKAAWGAGVEVGEHGEQIEISPRTAAVVQLSGQKSHIWPKMMDKPRGWIKFSSLVTLQCNK